MTDAADTPGDGEYAETAPRREHGGQRAGAGRESDYDESFVATAQELYAAGATDFEVGEALFCSRNTILRWAARHPAFREARRLGKEEADDRAERSLYERSVGYSYDAVKIMASGGVVHVEHFVQHVPPDVTAAQYWLQNRRPGRWKSKQHVETTGADGGPIQQQVSVDPQQVAALVKAFTNEFLSDC